MKNVKYFFVWLILLFYSLYKCILHLITGKCSLLRIIGSSHSNVTKFILLEKNIRSSKRLAKLNFLNSSDEEVAENISSVIRIKKIKEEFRDELAQYLQEMFSFSKRYKLLLAEVQHLQHEPVNICDNTSHKEILLRLWHNLRHGQLMGTNDLISADWTELGFQGKDPSTDFRGTGLLGLVQFEALSAQHTRECILVIKTPFEQGFPLALASINLSALVLNLLLEGKLRLALYEAWKQSGDLDDESNKVINSYNKLFGKIFVLFHEMWQREQPGVMQFNIEKEKFKSIFSLRPSEEEFIRQLI